MGAMYISEHHHNGTTVLELEGRLDTEGANLLEDYLLRACERGSRQVLLEMSNVNFINSSGLRVLARFLKLSQSKTCALKLVGIPENVQHIMAIVGLDQVFIAYESIQAAMAHPI
jgi:anti-sigma B factor antagonist